VDVLSAPLEHRHAVARTDKEGRDVHAAAVDGDVAVCNELPALAPVYRKAKPENRVVESPLEHREQSLARDALLLRGLLEEDSELLLEHSVNALDLLLLAKLCAIAGDLRTALIAAVLSRRCRSALLNGARWLEAPFTLQKELCTLSPAQPALCVSISRQVYSPEKFTGRNRRWRFRALLPFSYPAPRDRTVAADGRRECPGE